MTSISGKINGILLRHGASGTPQYLIKNVVKQVVKVASTFKTYIFVGDDQFPAPNVNSRDKHMI